MNTPQAETPFEQFFAQKIKERGVSLKKLSEATGIAPIHIESLLRGDYENMPSAPYFHGYLLHLGAALDFDGEEWWMRLKKEGVVKNSGAFDTLPHNRFLKQDPPKYIWGVIIAVIILVYIGFQAPHILGKPTITITSPSQTPYTTSSSTFTLEGTAQNADSLYLNNDQEIPIAPDGSWQQTVLLGDGLNPFKITAKKFLGGETDATEQIVYTPAPGSVTASGTVPGSVIPATSTASSSPSSSASARP